ncbi:MAG: PadR family transcriptional regulator [Anaerolineae bacterium]|nr:PadR family transcriptional regulator [Anaerolineae bacterium]
MSIKYAILGFLTRESLTGYDLKKRFADSDVLYWSGSNNQIYRSLVALHDEGLVTRAIEHQDDAPPRKIYTITGVGRDALRDWVLTPPEPPEVRHHFLIQLAWADQVDAGELNALLDQYAEEVHIKLLMVQEQAHRSIEDFPPRTSREATLRRAVAERWEAIYAEELEWVRRLRQDL